MWLPGPPWGGCMWHGGTTWPPCLPLGMGAYSIPAGPSGWVYVAFPTSPSRADRSLVSGPLKVPYPQHQKSCLQRTGIYSPGYQEQAAAAQDLWNSHHPPAGPLASCPMNCHTVCTSSSSPQASTQHRPHPCFSVWAGSTLNQPCGTCMLVVDTLYRWD
jgi:hypothetical protein